MFKFIKNNCGSENDNENVATKSSSYLNTKKSFQNLWVAGTLGAFFAAFATNIPIHIQQISWPANWEYTLELIVRYCYLLWFFLYFFVSNLGNSVVTSEIKKWDVWYDVGQSMLALSSACFLGFTGSGEPYGYFPYVVSNASIFLICLFSLIWFSSGNNKNKINCIRIIGAVVSGIAIMFSIFLVCNYEPQGHLWPYLVLLGFLFVLFVILSLFVYIRIREID